jgi:hypothetical protein
MQTFPEEGSRAHVALSRQFLATYQLADLSEILADVRENLKAGKGQRINLVT